jgi:hypothetical protein
MLGSCLLSILVVATPQAEQGLRSTLPSAEFGHGLNRDDSVAGWISLFDGETTFGWAGGKVDDNLLFDGRTNFELASYELRAEVAVGGQLTAGGKRVEVGPGGIRMPIAAQHGPIILGHGLGLRSIAVRPIGLRPIFNGNDLSGWEPLYRPYVKAEDRAVWSVANGALHAEGGKGSLEYRTRRFGDFVLQLDVCCLADEANGGVFFRNIPGDCMNGYEAQILNRCEAGNPGRPLGYGTGGLDDRQPARRLVSRDRQWFTMTVLAVGPHLATWVNGYHVIDWTDRRAPHENARHGLRVKPGTIQLQSHDAGTDILFKNIRIAELD